jgi:stage II sporulation protein D
VERYLPGVLAGELTPSFPGASLRAQAVASRTYALNRRASAPSDRPWHVTDDTATQVFRGLTTDRRLLSAVSDTRGMLLSWRGRPLPAYFHSTCGGHTAPAHEVFGGSPVPPLTGVPCEWCGDSRYFRWSAEMAFPDLLKALGVSGPLRGAEISRRGRGDRALQFSFLAPTPVRRSAADLRARLGTSRLRSTLVFEIARRGNLLVFRGGGWGHGVGMCQIGARGLAARGASAGDILAHYYPGALLSRWY